MAAPGCARCSTFSSHGLNRTVVTGWPLTLIRASGWLVLVPRRCR